MKTIMLSAVALMSCVCLLGCTPASSAQIDARALARGAVVTLNDAFLVAGDMCLSVAQAENNTSMAMQCGKILAPVYDGLKAAASAVDAWDSAAQSNFPCLIKSIVMSLSEVKVLIEDTGAKLPQLVDDAFQLASAFTPQCVAAADGGA